MFDDYDSKERVETWLRYNRIPYISDAKFLDLMGNSDYLRIDIYLPYHGICIEVDGQQHYFNKYNDINEFLRARDYDRRKDLFCLQHGLRMIRIVYDELPYLNYVLNFLLLQPVYAQPIMQTVENTQQQQ